MILAGDIGGTNTRLALVTGDGPRQLQFVHIQTFPSDPSTTLDRIVGAFLAAHRCQPEAACFGIAGPVRNGHVKLMNLDWVVDQRELSQALGIERVAVINDLEASAYGISCLNDSDLYPVNAGDPAASGHAVVVSPGTGLGEAGMYWDGRRYHPIATEGGHTDFAPRNQLEWELSGYLRNKYGYEHISYERVVSGPGLVDIYRFLCDSGRGVDAAWTTAEQQDDPGAVISTRATVENSGVCQQTLEVFFELCGAEAGNYALKLMATGGVWLGGGILVKNLARLKASRAFMTGFTDKGRLRALMERIPVKVVLNDKVALLGAANYTLGR